MPDPNDALREAYHRCSNDLQLVVSMLQLSASRCKDPGTQQTLSDIANRVRVLSHARSELLRNGRQDLGAVLREVCEALQAVAEPNGVLIRLTVDGDTSRLSDAAMTAAGLAVNELVRNSLKHAFKERQSGEVTVKVAGAADGAVIVIVDDDGLPFPDASQGGGNGHKPLGLDLARRMLATENGTLIPPRNGSKCFEIRLPVQASAGVH